MPRREKERVKNCPSRNHLNRKFCHNRAWIYHWNAHALKTSILCRTLKRCHWSYLPSTWSMAPQRQQKAMVHCVHFIALHPAYLSISTEHFGHFWIGSRPRFSVSSRWSRFSFISFRCSSHEMPSWYSTWQAIQYSLTHWSQVYFNGFFEGR